MPIKHDLSRVVGAAADNHRDPAMPHHPHAGDESAGSVSFGRRPSSTSASGAACWVSQPLG
jgi:hypothetical protein